MPPAVHDDRARNESGNEENPDPAADAARGADAVPEEDPEEELAEPADRADLRRNNAAARDRAAGCLEAELAALLLCRLRLGSLARALLEEVVVPRHQRRLRR